MPTVLSISSQVVRGHVGNSAVVFALQRLGIDVWPVPTVVLSNHPGHGATSRTGIDPARMMATIDRLEDHGWLGDIDAVASGYFAAPEQADIAARIVERVHRANPQAIYCCDPIMGDTRTGLYVPEEVAEAIRLALVPIADVVTPNLFELAWIAGQPTKTRDAAVRAARSLGRGRVLVTSAPCDSADRIANVLVSGADLHIAETRRFETVPHGTGDLMAALLLGQLLLGPDDEGALRRATDGLAAVIAASVEAGTDELRLIEMQARLNGA